MSSDEIRLECLRLAHAFCGPNDAIGIARRYANFALAQEGALDEQASASLEQAIGVICDKIGWRYQVLPATEPGLLFQRGDGTQEEQIRLSAAAIIDLAAAVR